MAFPDRRQFLLTLSGGFGALTTPRRRLGGSGAGVVAEATVFYAQPDGQRRLVRFYVSGLDAPAGRLRVYDPSGRLVGTAGVVPLADGRLYGELWVPPSPGARIVSELAAPGLRNGWRTAHTLTPAPKWTLYLSAVLEPTVLLQALARLAPVPRAVESTVLARSGAAGNPLPAPPRPDIGDVPFYRLAEPAARLERRFGIPVSTVAVAPAAAFQIPTLPASLAGSGVRYAILEDSPEPGLFWYSSPDGSRVLGAAVSAGSTPGALGLLSNTTQMIRAVERWLAAMPAPAEVGARVTSPPERAALILSRSPEEQPAVQASVRDWNARFAFPRIVLGPAEEYFSVSQRQRGVRITLAAPTPPVRHFEPPDLATTATLTASRHAERTHRADEMIACLATALGKPASGLAAVASELAFRSAGALIFNPAPYPRTELVTLPDGSDRLVTDVPPLGYAYVAGVSERVEWSPPVPETRTATSRLAVEIDPETGAITSLVTPTDGREWVSQGGSGPLGLNVLAGARVERITRSELSGVATRLHVERWSPARGAIRTTLTVYHALPWLDVDNDAEAKGRYAMEYGFHFPGPAAEAEWEIAGGVQRASPPVAASMLRWLRLVGSGGEVLFGSRDAAFTQIDAGGRLASFAPRGRAMYRIAVRASGAPALPDDSWRFGWGLEPLMCAPAPGTGGGALPSFGSLLVVDQSGVAVTAIRRAADGDGVIVYLQELSGRSRVVTVGAGLLAFERARWCDLVERDLGTPTMSLPNGAGIALPPWGVRALRLQGVTVSRR